MVRVCGQVAWPVDAALRPEGKLGPLVRTLASHQAYYARWARTWEFQALLKARPAAGDLALGAAYVETLAPLVWTAAEREHFVADVQAMRRRVDGHAAAGRRRPGDQARAGRAARRRVRRPAAAAGARPGGRGAAGRRHGRGDRGAVRRRVRRAGGRRPRSPASYQLLRSVEHRLQLQRLRRTHLVPDDGAGARRRWLARAMGFRPDGRGDAVAVFGAEWALHAREVRRLHEKLFYRPLLHAVARVPSDAAAADPGAGGPPAGGARLRRPGRRAAAPVGADRRGVPARGDPADAAAGGAERARRRAGPGRRAAGVPDGVRRARQLALVPAAAAGRGPGRPSGWRSCSAPAGTWPSCSAGRRRRCGSSATTPSCGRGRPRRCGPRSGPPRRGTRTRPRRSAPPARCAGRSCCGSPPPTCSGCSTRPRSARR